MYQSSPWWLLCRVQFVFMLALDFACRLHFLLLRGISERSPSSWVSGLEWLVWHKTEEEEWKRIQILLFSLPQVHALVDICQQSALLGAEQDVLIFNFSSSNKMLWNEGMRCMLWGRWFGTRRETVFNVPSERAFYFFLGCYFLDLRSRMARISGQNIPNLAKSRLGLIKYGIFLGILCFGSKGGGGRGRR